MKPNLTPVAISARILFYNLSERVLHWSTMYIAAFLLATLAYGWQSPTWPLVIQRLTFFVPSLIAAFTLMRDVHRELRFKEMQIDHIDHDFNPDLLPPSANRCKCEDEGVDSLELTTEEFSSLLKVMNYYVVHGPKHTSSAIHVGRLRQRVNSGHSIFDCTEGQLKALNEAVKTFLITPPEQPELDAQVQSAIDKINNHAASL